MEILSAIWGCFEPSPHRVQYPRISLKIVTMPRVSVLLPFRNEERFLPDCLESIQKQTFQDFELVAVDDGSEDASATIIQRARNLRLLSPGRIGFVNALNLGIRESQSPLIARMDADDVMLPQRLQAQCEFLDANPEVQLVSCLAEFFPREV